MLRTLFRGTLLTEVIEATIRLYIIGTKCSNPALVVSAAAFSQEGCQEPVEDRWFSQSTLMSFTHQPDRSDVKEKFVSL